jgi:hypothetical protein
MSGEHLNPAQFHPNMNRYQSGGMGHLPDDSERSVVGMVPLERVRAMPGNEAWNESTIASIQHDLRSGHGLKNPLMVEWSPKRKAAVLGEGNHRAEALHREGHTHAPVRVVRSPSISADLNDVVRGRRTVPLDPGLSPFGSQFDSNYWPSDIHPSYIFKDK